MDLRDLNADLELKRICVSDVSQKYVDWLNDTDVNKYLEVRHHVNDLEALHQYVTNSINSNNEFMFTILLSGEHVGNIKVSSIDFYNKFGTVSIIIGEKSCWGAGIARKSIMLLSDWCFKELRLHRLEAGIISLNYGSIKAFMGAGYRIEGSKLESRLIDGMFLDTISMAKVNNA